MGNKITRRRPVIDERYTRPQGLYPTRDVDQKKLRRLIIESKLAPCYPGAEETATDLEECPICFLHYPSLNRSKCCTKGVCTECFLQMKTPHAARPTQCPFCKTPQYAVEYRGAKTLEEKGMEQAEEQKVIEAKIRMRQQELQDDEEREQRREEDIRAGRIRLQTPRAQPHTNRQSQVHSISAPLERDTAGIDPYSLWVEGDYQREGDFDAAAPSQQSAVPRLSNTMSPVNQQQNEIDFSIPRFPPGAPRARHREEEFDLDLEDIMVMEAIWLSIQEQGAHHRFTEAEAIRPVTNRPSGLLTEISLDSEADVLPPPPPPVPELEPWEQRSGRQGTNTGSLAGAIAALAERQTVGDTDTATASQPTILSTLPSDFEVDHSASEISNVAEEASGASENTGNESERLSHNRYHSSQAEAPQRVEEIDFLRMLASTYRQNDAEKSSRASEKLANWVSSTQREYKSSSVGDHSSEQVEVGTSFASSVPSASELPWEAPEIPSDARNGESSGQGANNKKRLLPESFEEQMMLAMALSIADVQAARVRQGDNRSGPLPQPAYIGH